MTRRIRALMAPYFQRSARGTFARRSLATFLLAVFLPALAQAQEQRSTTVRLSSDGRKAITHGLEYLSKSQNKDGSWGGNEHPTADTSTAMLAFMLQGHVPALGPYGALMEKGIDYLLAKGEAQQGYLGTPSNHAGMYEHGLGILALSEAWGQSKNPKIRDTLRRAVDVTLRSQNDAGGWRYSPQPTDADLSMTVMQLVALNSARESGISVPDTTMQRATKYVLDCQDAETGGFAYTPKQQPGLARTGAGVMSLIMCGQRDHPAVRRGLLYMRSYPDSKFSNIARFYYTHYYCTLSMYQLGEEEFRSWYPRVASTLLRTQKSDGSWSGEVDPAWDTSMAILILGVPYRFLPIYQR